MRRDFYVPRINTGMAQTTLPANKSFYDASRFKFRVAKLPNVNFLVQSVNLPTLSLGTYTRNTTFLNYDIPGGDINWSDLNISFKLDEEFRAWEEIFAWMVAMAHPNNFEDYAALVASSGFIQAGAGDVTSEASLTIYTNHFNPRLEMVFTDLFPIQMGEVAFSSTEVDPIMPSIPVTFRYSRYYIRRLET